MIALLDMYRVVTIRCRNAYILTDVLVEPNFAMLVPLFSRHLAGRLILRSKFGNNSGRHRV